MVNLYAPLIYHWCHRHGVRGADADDILQEVFAGALRSIASFRREQAGQTFRAWLRGITRNKMLEFLRERGQEPQAQGGSTMHERLAQVADASSALTADPAEDPDDAKIVTDLFHRALNLVRAEFETHTWAAFWGTVVEGRLPNDVGADLKMSPNAVRTAKSRVLRRFREEVGDLAN
jgi:RNA polymerase sigma-70 factor (ECF subfamily)